MMAVLATISLSCQETIEGNGNVKKETRESAPFKSLEISGEFEVFITPNSYSSIEVEADENLMEHIETYVKGGTMHVSSEVDFGKTRALNLYINLETLEKLEADGAVKISSKGLLKGRKVKLDFSGSVEADLSINADELEGDFSGACELNLSGNADEARFETSGAVEINAEEFKTQDCKVDMSGAGSARVFASQNLEIEVSGAAEVRYKGNPGNVTQDISGAANIKPIQ